MVKLTAELIEQAAQYTNAVRDLELDLRGYKIPIIENLGATLDQFDAIDFSDNEIRKLDGFPLLRRLKTLLVNNNRICRIGEALDQALDQALPCLTELVLTNNSLVELRNLDPLASLRAAGSQETRYKIPVIENLGATLDQFDAIDFSDNEIRKLDGFPLLRRLKTLLVNNNRICRIGEALDQALPCLTELVLTNNSLVELGDLDPLASLKSLTYLSILRNPVTNKKHYRLYVIYKVPQVRVLDFQKVKLKERQEAEKMFKGKRGAQLAKDIARRSKTFNPGAGLPTDKKKGGPSPGDVEAIKNAIANASTLAEVERLKGLLQSGQIPGRERRAGPSNDGEEEMEEDVVANGS
ncbi:U2 small nuclear ribonucleoprotein A' [Myotis brandtii]|uniref:U2 small nuclear ribonucleoprotein A n=1 Tax=Myotis brandtii TaxID=109478 RepID=S7PQE5_MYOBR|nr:U2 small nuclear ribonucleoprotein A' [Myotis brandtii]